MVWTLGLILNKLPLNKNLETISKITYEISIRYYKWIINDLLDMTMAWVICETKMVSEMCTEEFVITKNGRMYR